MAKSADLWRKVRIVSASDRVLTPSSGAALWDRSNEEILDAFVARTAHDSGRTACSRRVSITAQLRRYALQNQVAEPALRSVLTDPALFGNVLAADRSLRGSGRVSRGTVRNTRRAFAALIAALPPSPGVTRDDLRGNLAMARRATEHMVGLRRNVAIGDKHPRRVPVPSPEEIRRVIAALRTMLPSGHPGPDLLTFLYLTGVRIGAALALTAADIRQMPDGTTWVFVQEKARPDARPVSVPLEQAGLALAWWQLPPDAPLWALRGRPIQPPAVRRWITRGCDQAGVPRFTPHNLRHAFARDLAPHLGLAGTQRAGGWLAAPVLEAYIDAGRPKSG